VAKVVRAGAWADCVKRSASDAATADGAFRVGATQKSKKPKSTAPTVAIFL